MKIFLRFVIICILGNALIFVLWSFVQQTQKSEWINSEQLLHISKYVIPASVITPAETESTKDAGDNKNTSWKEMLLGKGEGEESEHEEPPDPRKRLITPGDKEKLLRQHLGSSKNKMYVNFVNSQDEQQTQEIIDEKSDTESVQKNESNPGTPSTDDVLVPLTKDSATNPVQSAEENIAPAQQSDHWQVVILDMLYVFSAYVNEVDYESGAVVEVIGMKKYDMNNIDVKCLLMYGEAETTVAGKLTDIGNENTKRIGSFQSSLVVCPLPDGKIPNGCTVLSEDSTHNLLHVHYKEKNSYIQGSIHVCFAPFYNSYDDVSHVVEFVELHLLLGVSHFTFFNFSIGPAMEKMLHFYQRQGIATILQYELPHPRHIHIRGHHITVYDCRLRSRGSAEYLLLIDPDETIFPIESESLLPVLRTLDSPTASGFIFPCLYFCLEEADNKTALAYMKSIEKRHQKSPDIPFDLWTQLKTINPHLPCRITKNRINKIVLKPWKVKMTSIHYILKSASGYSPVIVKPYVASLHHYRRCRSGGHLPFPDVCPRRNPPAVDVVAHRYMHKLVENVYQVLISL